MLCFKIKVEGLEIYFPPLKPNKMELNDNTHLLSLTEENVPLPLSLAKRRKPVLCLLILNALLGLCFMSWQHDAACRVIARLKKERDEARALLAQAERQMPMPIATGSGSNAAALTNGKRGLLCYYFRSSQLQLMMHYG